MTEEREPVERMVELPEETRAFLSKLDPEDIKLLDEGLKLISSIMRVSRFLRWLILLILAGLATYIGFVESVQKIKTHIGPR